jgi:hypothetical protein
MAIAKAREVREFLRDFGFPEPVLADSGNGGHLLYRIDLPSDNASRDLLKRTLHALALLFDDANTTIDKTPFNAARIWKLYGTVARKGDNIFERPHRLARVLEAPALVGLVSPDQVREVAALSDRLETPPSDKGGYSGPLFDLARWIAEHGIEVARESTWAAGQRWILRHCLFDPTHSGTSAAILRLANGAIVYRCQHNSCADRRWKDVRRLFEPAYNDRTAHSEKEKKPSQAELLIEIARDRTRLFHDGDVGYGLVTTEAHKEVWQLKAKTFRMWLYQVFFEQHGKAANAEAISAALNTVEGFARFGSKGKTSDEHKVHLRIGEAQGKIYLDLCDPPWRAVEIDADGWRVIDDPAEHGVYFRRSRAMKALPVPLSGGSLASLKRFINVSSEEDFVLVISWLIGALHPRGPYPILALSGEHGSAKTSASRYLRGVIDPNISVARAAPRKEEDLLIAASNSWIVSFDNLSFISQNLSDGLCRLSTGGGLSKRELYTNGDEFILDARRPQIVTSIEEVAKSGDLINRLILTTLNRIDDQDRRTEDELDREFDAALPGILGALLDAVSCGLRNFEATRLDRPPRMADFAKWVVAAEPACPWVRGRFIRAYDDNREGANQGALEASPIYEPLVALDNFEGTATELLAELASRLPEGRPIPKGWPASPKALSGALRRIAPALHCVGIEVTFERGRNRSRTRSICVKHQTFDKAADSASEPSASSDGEETSEHISGMT